MTVATILIPAHNEEAVIGRTLLHASRGLSLNDFRIIVIANACTDATASKARSVLPQAKIIETDRPGKCHALNLGYAAADKTLPILCLDADLDVTAESLSALVAPLRDGAFVASCGHMDVNAADASPLVRTYYKGWRTNPYFDRGKFGGLFALAPAAAAQVFPLPEIIADDEFVRRSVCRDKTAVVTECRFVARAPATFASLLRVRRRSLRGAREIGAMGKKSPETGSARAVLWRALRHPSKAVPVALYLAVNAWIRLALLCEPRTRAVRWERDLTTRAAR